MVHFLRFSRSQWHPAGQVWARYRDWVLLLYGITLAVVANWAARYWRATDPLLLIAIGIPCIFVAPNRIGKTIGVLLALAGSVWLVLAIR